MKTTVYEVRVNENGSTTWWLNNKRHRVGGPAIEQTDGTKHWYQNDELHRTDGPALVRTNGTKEWWVDGLCMSEIEFNARTKPSCSGKVIEIDGKKYKLMEIV